jgi:hypothetical protein
MSTTATKEASAPSETEKATGMTASLLDPVGQLFNEGLRSYEKAVRSNLELQKECIKLSKEVLAKFGTPEEFKANVESLSAAGVLNTRKRVEEFVDEAQSRVQDLVESSLDVQRTTIDTILNTNAKVIGLWKDLVDRVTPVAA